MKKVYNKLVRDKIPEIIKQEQSEPKIRILKQDEYLNELLKKLDEEIKELAAARSDKKEMDKEIGDIYEVLEAIIKGFGLSSAEIMDLKNSAMTRGAVLKRKYSWKALIININTMIFFHSKWEKNKDLILQGVINSLGAVAYIIVVVMFLSQAEKIFGKADTILAPMIMLTLFVMSALITGLIILGKPVMLYFDGQKKESIKMLFFTVAGLVMLFMLMILAYILIK